ncbi:MAG TPA: DUF1570 domain-containing protein [Planctomycetota bacterium]|nr:DUF1570 domain-containing protein [Planctomycetota bacterium]
MQPASLPRTGRRARLALLAAALLLPAFDQVLLKDGRTITGTIVASDDPHVTRLRIGQVEVPIRNELIDKTWVEMLAGYVPKDKLEEEQLRQGNVLFEGSWMSRTRREDILRKRADADRAAIAELQRRQDWKNAVVEETRHFIVTSNCTDAVRREYEERLEAYYKAFTDDWGITLSPGDVRGKLKFMLYRDYDDFLRETRQVPGVGGFFSFATGELQLYDDMQVPEQSRDTLFHEGNHLLTYLIDTHFRYPTWLNEGLAEYYGTAEIDARGRFHAGDLQYGRIVSLRTDRANGTFLHLRPDVLLVGQEDYGYRQYAYGWSFVHFLMQSPRYAKPFRSFFVSLPKNQDVQCKQDLHLSAIKTAVRVPELTSVAAALEKRLGKSVEALEQEWLAWIDANYGELTPLAWYKAAGLALDHPRADGGHVRDAMEYLDRACSLGIEVSACYRQYAELLRRGGAIEASETSGLAPPDTAKAWAIIQKAIQLDPIDGYNYVEAAGILILDGPLQDLPKAQSLCDTAAALAGKDDWALQKLIDELRALIQPALAPTAPPSAGSAAGGGSVGGGG